MTDKLNLPLPPSYKHQVDTRTDMQKFLSDQIVRNMSQLNFKRIHAKKSQCTSYTLQNKYFFICLTGLPPFQNQFQNLDLPGQKIVYTLTGQSKNHSQQQYTQIFAKASFSVEADNIHKIVSQIPSDYKIVFVFHSFGGFIFTSYVHRYPATRAFGIIDVGSIPVTLYPVLLSFLKPMIQSKLTDQLLFQNAESFYEAYLQKTKTGGFFQFKNKYTLVIWLKIVKSNQLGGIFEWARNYPKVLKLICFGRKDTLFTENALNQKCIHYSYVNKFQPNYEAALKNIYQKIYNQKVNNVQQRFIFSFENGKHSLHMQPKLQTDLKAVIKQYLWLLDQCSRSLQ